MDWKRIFDNAIKRGFIISYSDGPMFDPRDQERTSAYDDLNKAANEKAKREGKDVADGFHK